jgi:hypothetical protein
MTPLASTGTAPIHGAIMTDPTVAPEQRQSPLERLLAEPGPLDRFMDTAPASHRADADHGATLFR